MLFSSSSAITDQRAAMHCVCVPLNVNTGTELTSEAGLKHRLTDQPVTAIYSGSSSVSTTTRIVITYLLLLKGYANSPYTVSFGYDRDRSRWFYPRLSCLLFSILSNSRLECIAKISYSWPTRVRCCRRHRTEDIWDTLRSLNLPLDVAMSARTRMYASSAEYNARA